LLKEKRKKEKKKYHYYWCGMNVTKDIADSNVIYIVTFAICTSHLFGDFGLGMDITDIIFVYSRN
jgi:hypothetical protein